MGRSQRPNQDHDYLARMKDGTVLLWRYMPSDDKWADMFMRLICYFTNSDYVHAEIYVRGATYGMNQTATKYAGIKPHHEAWEPIATLTTQQELMMHEYVETAYVEKWAYDVPKVIALAFIYNTRWLWKRLRWVPFQGRLPSEVCSAFVDIAYYEAGVDLLPTHAEWYTAPCDFTHSTRLRKTE